MGLFAIAKRLYSLDTLDTRFTTSSRRPPRDKRSRIDPAQPSSGRTVSGQDEKPESKTVVERNSEASPSKWRTPEFFVYYFVFVTVVPMMFKVTYDVSKESHPNYSSYAHLLSPGWIPGRKVDNSDAQYSTFRDNIPYMFLVLALHPFLRRLYNTIYPIPESPATVPSQPPKGTLASTTSSLVSSVTADARLNQRVAFDLLFAAVFLCALHGFSAPKVLLILYINFMLATRLPKAQIPIVTWIFNVGILFANEYYKGYPYGSLVKYMLPGSASAQTGSEKGTGAGWGSWLDAYGGLMSRWEILFNITVLRLISFNLDYYWSLDRNGGSPIEKKQLDPADLSERERERVDTPAGPQDYSFRNYLAYILYSPLYLAGPILTFNDYISQLRYTPSSIKSDRTILYAIRFLITLLTMELMLHFIYAVAISKAQPAWQIYTPFQLSMLGYFNLHIIWLKLLLPWRFFRLWALLDGVDPPENMVRCMSDNYSALAFWRGWHRSFNRWIVRYIYIPLGGSGGPGTHGYWGKGRAMVNFLLVFTFVAIWHDINLKLLIWGWLITLFVLPEVLAGLLFPKRKWQSHKETYRIICSIGAVGNILMMMAANLVGFAIGLDGLRGLVRGIVGSYYGILFLGAACTCLFIGVQIMFEVREQELREDNLDSETRSTADQSATTNSGLEQHLVPQGIHHLEANRDSSNAASTDQSLTTDPNTERVVFTLFNITTNCKAKVKETLTNFRRTVLIFWVRLENNQLPGMYVGVLDGSNSSPDETVLVEMVQDQNKIGRELSDVESIAEEERREIQETYHEQYSEVLKTLTRNGWLEVGRAVDPSSEEGMEIKEKLRGRRLELYGVHL